MNMIPKADGVIDIKQEAIHEALYAFCSLEGSAFAPSHFRFEPGAPFGHPVTTTAERWGRIPRYYIERLRDRAITLKLQQDMQKDSPCQQTFPLTPIIPHFSPHLSSLQIVFFRLAAPRGCYGRFNCSCDRYCRSVFSGK
jgi:hypothetical protein